MNIKKIIAYIPLVFLAFFVIPLLLTGKVYAKTCIEEIKAEGHNLYNRKVMKIDKSCTELVLTLLHYEEEGEEHDEEEEHHDDPTEGELEYHNLVISETKHKFSIVNAGIVLGLQANFVDKNDKRVLAYTPMLPDDSEATIKIDLSKFEVGGDYEFYCTYPGHAVTMFGKFMYE